jgi:hypothetical protein
MNYFQEKTKQPNSRKTKPRYKAKRERRAYLTEAFVDGELALYKPTPSNIPYWQYLKNKIKSWDENKLTNPNVSFKKLSLWQKLMNFIDSIFIKFRKRFYEKK